MWIFRMGGRLVHFPMFRAVASHWEYKREHGGSQVCLCFAVFMVEVHQDGVRFAVVCRVDGTSGCR